METPRKGPAGETVDTPRHRALGSASRVEILRLVRATGGGLTAGDVAERTGLHFSTVRAHLDRLTEAGLLVKARASGGQPGRPAWRYRPVAAETAPAPAPYRALAAALLDHLGGSGAQTRTIAAAAGERWGRHLAAATAPHDDPVERVTAVLGGLGFSPRRQPAEPDDTDVEIHLHTCPFLELVGQNPDAMCGLHAGVVRGVLGHADAARDEPVLEPFGAPTACVVRIPSSARLASTRLSDRAGSGHDRTGPGHGQAQR